MYWQMAEADPDTWLKRVKEHEINDLTCMSVSKAAIATQWMLGKVADL